MNSFFFNKNLLGVLLSSGVSMGDVRAVEGVLNTTKSSIVTA